MDSRVNLNHLSKGELTVFGVRINSGSTLDSLRRQLPADEIKVISERVNSSIRILPCLKYEVFDLEVLILFRPSGRIRCIRIISFAEGEEADYWQEEHGFFKNHVNLLEWTIPNKPTIRRKRSVCYRFDWGSIRSSEYRRGIYVTYYTR
jgi:hypothetical protein